MALQNPSQPNSMPVKHMAAEIEPQDALSDMEVLCQMVEACLFINGEMVAERDLSEELHIPRDLIHNALLQLEKNYRYFNCAIRVRNTHEDYWIMDLKDMVSESVECFYLEDKPFTKSEIMTLSFIGYMQPVPKHVLKFCRGSNATSHASKLEDSGFITQLKLSRDDASLEPALAYYRETKRKEEKQLPDVPPNKDNPPVKGNPGKKKQKRKSRKKKKPSEYTCYKTTPKFAGYFDLPSDPNELKASLDEMKEIYNLLG